MRNFAFFFLMLFSCALLAADSVDKKSAEKKKSEATVRYAKEAEGIRYTITIDPPFKMNLDAPFKFELRKSETELIAAVPLDRFTKDKKAEVYTHLSTAGEKRLHYWFIACKYKDGKVVSCKTFVDKIELP